MKLTKSKLSLTIIGIFLLAVISMFGSIFSPAIAEMYGVFSENIPALNYLVSGSALIGIISMLLCPYLEKLIGTKRLLLIGALLLAISGLAGLFSFDIHFLCVVQSINACGYGITGTLALSVLMTVLTTDKSRSFFNGIYQVVIAASGSVFAIVGGILAATSWKKALSAAWWVCCILGFAAAIILMLSLPKEIDTSNAENQQVQSGEKTKTPWGGIMVLFIGFLIIGLAYQYINLLMSVYVEENALGDAVFTGTMQSLGTIGSAVMCFCFGFVYPKLKKKLIIIPLSVLAVFLLLFSVCPSRELTILGAVLMGASFGCSDVYFYTICPDIAPNHLTTAIAWVGLALNLPYMLFSYMYTALAGVFGTLTASLKLIFVLILVELIITSFIVLKKKK